MKPKPSDVWLDLVGEVPEFAPELPYVNQVRRPIEVAIGGTSEAAAIPRLAWQRLSEIEMRSIVFADRPIWQADAFHLLAGRTGVGKGTCIAGMAARVTRGELGSKRGVVWIASEDSAAIDIKPRVIAAGGDPERIAIVTDWLQLPRDVAKLRNTVTEVSDVGLVVIDPVGNHITGKNSNAETDIRDAIAPLNALADELELILVGVRHLTEKEASRGILAAILGSSAWVQIPRAVVAIVRDDQDAEIAHIQCVAGNRLPPDTPGRAFRIVGVKLDGLENEVTRADWIGDSTKDVNALLEQQPTKKTSKSDTARELILDLLEQASATQIESDALDAQVAASIGISVGTVRNLRTELKDAGLIKPVPIRDEFGTVERWMVARTLAPRQITSQITTPEDPASEPDHDSSTPKSEKWLNDASSRPEHPLRKSRDLEEDSCSQ